MVKILDLLSQAEALRGGFVVSSVSAGETDTNSPASAAGDGGSARRRRSLLRNGVPRSAAPGIPTDGQDARRQDGRGLRTSRAAGGRQKELEVLRQAVRMQDALGYDEPPPLPVPTRLYLAATLLRGNDGDGGGGGGAGTTTATAAIVKAEAEEAEIVLRELEGGYPNMGRTLLGLWRACSALGEHDEAQEFRQRFLASWQYSEVWLADSAHVGGVGAEGQPNVGHGESGEPEGDFSRGGGDRGGTTAGPDLVEKEVSEQVDRRSGMTTKATVVLAAIGVAALSLVAAVAVAARRKYRAAGCGSGGFRELSWKRYPAGAAGTEETANVAQTQAHSWRGIGSGRKGYHTIGE